MTRPMMKRAERWPLIWAAIVTVLLVALAGTALAYLHATAAINCTNDALGTRSNVGQADAVLNKVLGRSPDTLVADSDVNRAVYRELNHLQVTQAQRDAYKAAFFPVLQHAQLVLDANQAFRVAHPIGECN